MFVLGGIPLGVGRREALCASDRGLMCACHFPTWYIIIGSVWKDGQTEGRQWGTGVLQD